MKAPSFLFGPTREARKRWSKVARAMIRGETYRTFNALELREIDFDNEMLIVDELSPGWSTAENVWNFHLVHSRWLIPGNLHSAWHSQFKAVMCGFQFDWFHLGMVFTTHNDLYFLRQEAVAAFPGEFEVTDSIYKQEIIAPFLDCLLSRVLEVSSYSRAFYWTYPLTPPDLLEGSFWLKGIVHIARMYGVWDWQDVGAILSKSPHDIFDRMEKSPLLRRTEQGFRVAEPIVSRFFNSVC